MAAEPYSVFDIGWRLFAVFLLVVLNGFFVAAEFSIVKVRASQLLALEQKGSSRAKRARKVVDQLDAYLSATQLGITIASIGLGWIGEPAVASLIEPAIGPLTGDNTALLHTISFALSFAIITFLHIVFGELAPKSIAIQKSTGTTMAIAQPLRVFYFIFRPAIWALNGTANALLRLVGIQANPNELAHSEEELRILLAESGKARTLSKRRAEILTGVLDLRERSVSEIMVPRYQMTALSTSATLGENVAIARESGYTRFPLARNGNVDDIVGMVHLKDLVWYTQTAPPDATVTALRRDILIVPDSLPAERLLNRFLARRAHMALVLDEYGGTAGIVTLEDVIEEFLGEIQDEFDTDEATLINTISDHEWLIDGTTPIHRVAELLEIDLESEEVSTFGGYLVEQLGRVPPPGTEVDLPGHKAVVRTADRKRVKSIHVTRKPIGEEEGTD